MPFGQTADPSVQAPENNQEKVPVAGLLDTGGEEWRESGCAAVKGPDGVLV